MHTGAANLYICIIFNKCNVNYGNRNKVTLLIHLVQVYYIVSAHEGKTTLQEALYNAKFHLHQNTQSEIQNRKN